MKVMNALMFEAAKAHSQDMPKGIVANFSLALSVANRFSKFGKITTRGMS
ncbi:MAG: hypothetical protein RLZZ535_2994 [Cyanobacteriota bacterium]|jgi:hypothetical protein